MSTAARRHVVLLGGRPLVIVDVVDAEQDGPVSRPTDPEIWSFVDAGLRLLPGFLGQALAVAPGLALDLDDDLDVRTADGEVALHVPGAELDDAWRAACDEHGGCLVLLGRNLDLTDLDTAHDVGTALDTAARAARLVGAVVDTPQTVM